MLHLLAIAVVLAAGLYLMVLGVALLAKPASAARFLMGHASSGPLHCLELFLRIGIGLAFVHGAPALWQPGLFRAFGWVLVGTSAALMLVPWQWHQRLAQRSVPQALRFTPLIGIASLLMGGFVLVATLGWPGG